MKRKLPFTFEEFKTIYSKVPRLCVDLVVETNKGYLLTLRQKNGYEGQWHIPGGTVYYREAIKKSVERVAKEELGIKISITKFLGYLEYFSEVKERGFGYTVTLVFLCKAIGTNFHLDDQTEKVGVFKKPPINTIVEQKKLLNKLIYKKSKGEELRLNL
jgi:ADP-ribose pyrophosphatase YjhB (NUDIX family)